MFLSHINESLLIIKAITEIILIADILEDESLNSCQHPEEAFQRGRK